MKAEPPDIPLAKLREIAANVAAGGDSLRSWARLLGINSVTLLHRLRRFGLPTRGRAPRRQLTPREAYIHRLCSDGMTVAEIADRMGLRKNTVALHGRRARRKLGGPAYLPHAPWSAAARDGARLSRSRNAKNCHKAPDLPSDRLGVEGAEKGD